MGRPKGSKNKATAVKIESPPQKTKSPLKQEPAEKAEVFAVSVLETPLLLCRACRCSFETTEEYALHPCSAQTYTVAIENEAEEETADYLEEVDIEEADEETEKPAKKPRKPYKKREKKAGREKDQKDPVQCPTCQKTFTRKYHLERHLIHTQCNPGTFERQEFSCEVCDKKFSRIDNLRMHLRAHLGQKSRSRDFQCPYCEKSFYGSSLLNIHVRTHTRKEIAFLSS